MSHENQLDRWTAAIARELAADLGVELGDTVDQQLLLDVARDAAHAVDRPAAPITTYLVGVAVAKSQDPDAQAKAAAAVSRLAAQWDIGLQD
jgi:hypothetical protein